MSRRDRRHQQLRRQLGFLERSLDAYDRGYADEAIRTAVILRILLHDTKRQSSLLTQFGQPNILLLTTVEEPRPDAIMFHGMGMFRLTAGTAALLPSDGDGGFRAFVPAPAWWQQVVFIVGGGIRLSRKAIALNAADKDGGAHVDPALTPEYESLLAFASQKAGVISFGGFALEGENLNVHLVALRQMAYEVLHSPALTALASDAEA